MIKKILRLKVKITQTYRLQYSFLRIREETTQSVNIYVYFFSTSRFRVVTCMLPYNTGISYFGGKNNYLIGTRFRFLKKVVKEKGRAIKKNAWRQTLVWNVNMILSIFFVIFTSDFRIEEANPKRQFEKR